VKAMRPARMGRTLGLVAVVAASIGLGYLVRGPGAATLLTGETEERPAARAGQETVEFWTCSMHPQVRQEEPGLCPICGMELVPVVAGPRGERGPGALRRFATSEEAAALMDIRTAPVEARFVPVRTRLVGKVTYDETLVRHVTAWVPGRLDRLYVDYTGVPVVEGEHMVELYSPELISAQEELLQAVRSAGELEGSSLAVMRETAVATVRAARDKLRLLGLKDEQVREVEHRGEPLDRLTIYSPMTGTVIEKHASEGIYVSTGSRIYTIADLSEVWVELDAYESDLAWLRYGQRVTFGAEAYPAETFIGQIAFIAPVVDARTRTVAVRVNVSNPEGKLKPDMFVRGEVVASVAAGGRVMAPDLAGRWICPMHPEVIRAGEGACDRCGMPLVTTESLGYAAVDEEGAKPLVIPVSAALVTGTRAVVYVEDPEADHPTFEGREIVLGPRAGDYYVVRHGLAEGERVVTSGNFKIDSALQIMAKPSMMSPGGAGARGAHRHGAEGAPGEETVAEAAAVEVPPAFVAALGPVASARRGVQTALQAEDLVQVRRAFQRLGDAVDAVDASGLTGHAAATWRELGILLGNDAAEGAYAGSLAQAREVAAALGEHAGQVEAAFGLGHEHVVGEEQPGAEEAVPAEFREQLGAVWAAYLGLHEALVEDDAGEAQAAVTRVHSALAGVDMALLSRAAHADWMRHLGEMGPALEQMGVAADLAGIREAFAPFSYAVAAAIERFGLTGDVPVFQIKCPMAFGGQGATWLQADREVSNPYFGQAMLRCGELLKEIGPAAPGEPPEPQHGTEHVHE
jgi:Cu(I)/Ag(I) efflux system membrane fusion protein